MLMYFLTIDTEHEPGSVAIVSVNCTTPDVQAYVTLGKVAMTGEPLTIALAAEKIAQDAGWLVSGVWKLMTDQWASPVNRDTAAARAASVSHFN